MITHIFLDIDRTLTNSQKEITTRTRQALLQVQNQGYTVALCTGRQWLFLDYMINPLEFFPAERQHIISGGAQICTSQHQIIWQNLIPASLVTTIFAAAKEENVLLLTTNNTQILINQPQAAKEFVQTHPVNPQTVIFQPQYDHPLSLLNCHHLTPKFLEVLAQNKVHYKLMHTYHDETYIDLTAQGVNKGSALKNWSVLNHVPLSNIAMVGDSENDLEALEAVGNPYIMGNAVPALKKFGFPTLADADQDGLAIWLESLPPISR